METIYFSKRFTGGNLKGLTVHCSSTAPTLKEAASRWHIGKKGKDYCTKAPWVIVDASFQKYDRG